MEPALHGHQSDEQGGTLQFLFHVQRDALCHATHRNCGTRLSLLDDMTRKMAVFTMASAARRARKPKGYLPNPFAEGAETETKYNGIREWRGEDLISLL